MKNNIKIIALVATIISAIIGAFIGGTSYGINTAYKLYTPELAKEIYSRTITTQIVLEQIDKNEILEAHNLMDSGLMGDILVLDEICKSEEKVELKYKIKGLLTRIAKHRAAFAEFYKSKKSELPNEESKVDKILKRYLITEKSGT